jgi:hypothetical protein
MVICASFAWQIIGLNKFQQALDSDWYVSRDTELLENFKDIAKFECILEGRRRSV